MNNSSLNTLLSSFSLLETISCVTALINVLNQRKHTRLVLGEEVIVQGSLSKALKLPELLKQLQSPQRLRQEAACEQFNDMWPTLSEATRVQVLKDCDWYDPATLDWDDPRSNKKASMTTTENKRD